MQRLGFEQLKPQIRTARSNLYGQPPTDFAPLNCAVPAGEPCADARLDAIKRLYMHSYQIVPWL